MGRCDTVVVVCVGVEVGKCDSVVVVVVYMDIHVEVGRCDSGPCRNGATCIDVDESTYTCSCAPGFTGTHCENGLYI